MLVKNLIVKYIIAIGSPYVVTNGTKFRSIISMSMIFSLNHFHIFYIATVTSLPITLEEELVLLCL